MALATAVRLVAFTAFLVIASVKAGRIRPGFIWKNGLGKVVAALALFAAALAVNGVLGGGLWGAGACLLVLAAAAYFRLLDGEERAFIARSLHLRRAAAPAEAAGPEGGR